MLAGECISGLWSVQTKCANRAQWKANRSEPTAFERMRKLRNTEFATVCGFELRAARAAHSGRQGGNSRSRTKKRCAAQNTSDEIAGLTAAVAVKKDQSFSNA